MLGTFNGKATVKISSLDVDQSKDLLLKLEFSTDRKKVQITDFPPIITDEYDTPAGKSTTTITLASGGVGMYDPDTGYMKIDLKLHFDQSIDLPIITEDTDLSLQLRTDIYPGAVLNPETGEITLVAESKFMGGVLGGRDCSVIISGTISFVQSNKPSNVALIEYKITDGVIAIDLIHEQGTGTQELWRGQWSPGWTTIEPFSLNGQVYLFEYKVSDGTVAIDLVNGDLSGTQELWRGQWSPGWTIIEPFSLNGQAYLFEYKVSDGIVAIDQVGNDGCSTNELWRSQWSSGWTSIKPYTLNNTVYLVEYKNGDGTVAIDQVNSDGVGSQELWRDQWSPGWTTIEPFGVITS